MRVWLSSLAFNPNILFASFFRLGLKQRESAAAAAAAAAATWL